MANTSMYGGGHGNTVNLTNTLNAGVTKGRFLKYDGTGYADLNDDSPGVNLFDVADDEVATVQVDGMALCEAGAAIATADKRVETDSVGRVVGLNAGRARGKALDTADAAGDFIRVLLTPGT